MTSFQPACITQIMPSRKLVDIDLVEGVKVKYLDLPDMKVTVLVEIDSDLQDLINKGKEGLRWAQLADAAENYTKDAKKTVKEELERLDGVVATLDEDARAKKIAEVKSVLKQVAAGQESGVNAAVEKEWDAAVRRQASLSKFKFKCVVKAAVGALAIASSLTSVIASGGSALVAGVVIFKSAAELAVLAGDIAQNLDEAAGELQFDMEAVRKQIQKETPTRTDQVLSDLSPILGKIMSTVKTADQNQLKLEAKIASFEKETDNAVGKLNEGLDKVSKIKTQEKKKQEFIAKLEEQARGLIEQISAAHKEAQPLIKFNEEAFQEIKEWKAKRQPKTVAAIRASSFTKVAVGLLSAARAFAKVAGAPIP